MGYEIAQSNTAWILEQSQHSSPHTRSEFFVSFVRTITNLIHRIVGTFVPLVSVEPSNDSVCGELTALECESQALRYWKQAAKQHNADAALKVGDYAFYGLGEYRNESAFEDEPTGQVDLSDWSQLAHSLAKSYGYFRKHLGFYGNPSAAAKHYQMAADLNQPQVPTRRSRHSPTHIHLFDS